jgi:glutamate/tyrosine decarboxylase-like PLP-dependent enzyme
MCISDLQSKLELDNNKNIVPIAIVATAGTTSTGAIDPIQLISQIAKQQNIWLHVDGAYGLPGILDPNKTHLFNGLEHADSVIVDPHKWMGAPVGIGATFVRDKNLLVRAFSQGSSDYLEGSFDKNETHHSMQSMGTAYTDMGLELSAPSRGVVVWAILKELGKLGFQERICRHNAMAKWLAEQVTQHEHLELALEPTLSICCFRYVSSEIKDLNTLNRNIHKQLLSNNNNMPSTALINENLYLRPCFIGAKTQFKHVYSLLEEVIEIGKKLTPPPSNTHLCKETL